MQCRLLGAGGVGRSGKMCAWTVFGVLKKKCSSLGETACPQICTAQGVCKNGVCVCQPGYRGAYCEIAPQCTGILDLAGNCCQHGVVDVNGTCCSNVSFLHTYKQILSIIQKQSHSLSSKVLCLNRGACLPNHLSLSLLQTLVERYFSRSRPQSCRAINT